jgi:hypothetical protein
MNQHAGGLKGLRAYGHALIQHGKDLTGIKTVWDGSPL